MAYFLKRSNLKKGRYLQIYESFYDPDRKQTAHRSVRALGYVHELEESGIEDPEAHFKAEVDAMNAERGAKKAGEKARRIGDSSPERLCGYFPIKAVNEGLGVKGELAYLQLARDFRFPVADLLEDLVCAQAVMPSSKKACFDAVLPRTGLGAPFSLDQLYAGLEFLGANYRKVIEAYNLCVDDVWGRDASRTFFDGTNFYFEVDAEDDLRRKGPSKENRKDPIVGLGLLCDSECIPLDMRVYPGNASEMPRMRESLADMRRTHAIEGRTVTVADKGLNCADNIAAAVAAGDGYIFSKSVKRLSAQERAWALAGAHGDWEGWECVMDGGDVAFRCKEVVDTFDYEPRGAGGARYALPLPEKRIVTYNPKLARKQTREIDREVNKARDLRLAGAKRSEFGDCAKFVTFTAVDRDGCVSEDSVACALNHDAIERAKECAGFNMLVTSETGMAAADVYRAYHELWRIEESFRTMKSQLEARPVRLQNPDSIKGHFLVCYLALLLTRLFQVRVLKGRFGTEEVMRFVRDFRVVRASERRYVNLMTACPMAEEVEALTGLPVNNYYLTPGELAKIEGYVLKPSPEERL